MKMNKRIRIVIVCFVLLLLAAFLRIQLTYEDKSEHHGRGPPSVLINSDTRELAAEKRYETAMIREDYFTDH